MKYLRIAVWIIFTSVILISCGRKEENGTPTNEETPQALQDSKLEIKSYRRSGDLVEELYQELVEKTPTLKKLEDDIADVATKSNDINDKFNQFESKTKSYYSSSKDKATSVKDSLLRKKLISLIEKSSSQYSANTADVNLLVKQFSKNNTSLSDHHSALKIILTIPIIHKFQKNNKPDKKEFRDLIKQQENLIRYTDSLTQK